MAANQTIIKAAGQRYTSVPVDYSGYIKGLQSVTEAVIKKTKENKKNKASIDKLMVDFNSKIKPYSLLVKDKIGNAKTPEKAAELSKNFTQQKIKYEAAMTTMHSMLEDKKQLSNSISPHVEMWMRSFGAGDFDKEYTVETPGVGEEGDTDYVAPAKHVFNMSFRLNEDLEAEVIGPDGEYIGVDELEDLLNVPNNTDGAKVNAVINNFATLSENKWKDDGTQKDERNFLKEKVKAKDQIKNLFKIGDGDISGEDVKTAFMFDEVSGYVDGSVEGETSFLKYYLSNDKLFPPEFKDKYLEYKKMLDSEVSEKQLAIIAQDLIANDLNIDSDLDKYIDYLLEFNR